MVRMLVKILILSVFVVGTACAKRPMSIDLKGDEYQKYWDADASNNIKFGIEDYVGEWKDPQEKEDNFIFNSDLSLEKDWRKAKCKVAEQGNNFVIMSCSGDLGKSGIVQKYVGMKVYYYSDYTHTKAYQNINVVFNHSIDCVKANLTTDTLDEKCDLDYDQGFYSYSKEQ